jgi:hypothetical protein
MKFITKYLRLIIPHLGIAMIALAMILGHYYNWRGKAVLLSTDKTNVFITKNKEIKITPFALTLASFHTTFYDSGEPKDFEAMIEVEDNNSMKIISISVNHPCKMSYKQDLYLISYDNQHPENPEYCVVELVHDPFQGIFLAGILIIILSLIIYVFIPNVSHY